ANSSYYHSLALDATGNVWAWGGNAQGQLGNGTNTYSNTVVSVTGLGGVTAICTGYRMSMALKSDGTVWTWGENTHGQLGDGSTTDRNLPVQVMGLSGIVAIAAGNIHCLALKNDGTVWAWGFNDQGELGNGSTAESHVPVQVTGLAGQNVTYIEAGARQSFAVTSSGNVYAWGGNESGQLMNGTNTDNLTPTLVSGICGGQSAIAENEEDAAFSIYPNPVSDNITLSTLQGGPFAFELHNSAGQLLLSNKNTGNTAISMADFAPGIYFVIMKQNEKTYRKKIVKL
ncbi:MAG TPA: T9SS type A sorting domain-containing protein, partial [Chitinophagales bacterium]|nr:T9SS type A sorting domain-containing protein [Chitinophagales bacterium]